MSMNLEVNTNVNVSVWNRSHLSEAFELGAFLVDGRPDLAVAMRSVQIAEDATVTIRFIPTLTRKDVQHVEKAFEAYYAHTGINRVLVIV